MKTPFFAALLLFCYAAEAKKPEWAKKKKPEWANKKKPEWAKQKDWIYAACEFNGESN